MSSITIIGLGSMARALADRALDGGNTVEVVGRDARRADTLARELGRGATAATASDPLAGDIVILATPYASAVQVVRQYGDALAGKVIIDISNTFDLSTWNGLVVPDGTSGAQEIAAAATAGAHVVKAFNTIFGSVLAQGRSLDVLIAGDDAAAKASVSAFVESLGMRPLDAGPLTMARRLEEAGLLVMGLGRYGMGSFNFSLAVRAAA
ncbi:MAG TPA: NAD(P)-binding domain-containing protein [Trebonia sp.]|nr:NAD(P)-binding domain-containing protein [Trebonia sp.]